MATYKGTLKTSNGDILYPATDASKVSGLSTVATSGSYNDLSDKPILALSKTFTGVYSTAADAAHYYIYFGQTKPTNWNTVWSIKYRMTILIGNTAQSATYECYVSGAGSVRIAYSNFNSIKNTSYYPIYYTTLTTETEASYNNGNGHLIGVYLGSSYSPTSSTYARTVNMEILETINCTFEFFDTHKIESQMPATWAVSSRSNADAVTQGLQETGDANSINQLVDYYTTLTVGSTAIVGTSIAGIGADGKVVPIISNTSVKPPFRYKDLIFRVAATAAGGTLYNVAKILENC